jgi:DNA-binding PadR family transcriptional regulator
MPITRTDLIILAFLSEKPAHAWEIDRRLIEMGADFWAEYSRPHLYYSLRKLARSGLVELLAREQAELKKEYRLTDQGRETLQNHEVVEQLFYNHVYFDFDLLLGFADRFAADTVSFKRLLEHRQEALQNELEGIQQVWAKAEREGAMSFGKLAVIKHRIKFLKSEIDFLKWLDKNTPEEWRSLNRPGGE